MRMIYGIDPGEKGAICIMNSETGEVEKIYDMPLDKEKKEVRVKAKAGSATKTVKKIKTSSKVNARSLSAIFDYDSFTVIEKVAAMPGQGVSSMFSFGETFGAITAVAQVMSEHVSNVRPNEWQKHFGLTMSKEEKEGLSKSDITKHHKRKIADKVIEIYPHLESFLVGKRGGLIDGRADAILIARYFYETQK